MEQFRVKSREDLLRDLVTGVVVALLSVPLSMGYAMVAGLPPQYGLYGTLCSVLIFCLLTSSHRFAFGVDAAPAALVGNLLPSLGIAHRSGEAVAAMPMITLMTGLWLLLFWLLKGGKYAKFISESVLAGCVTGIASIVILTQAPLLFGGTAVTGRAPRLLQHLVAEMQGFHLLSFAMGAATIFVILFFRKRTRMSLSVVTMALGIAGTLLFHPENYGVALLGEVPVGLPKLATFNPHLMLHHLEEIVVDTLAIALVVVAETLVTTREVAREHDVQIDNQKELLAYALANLGAAMFSSSPASGSISRTRRAERRGVSSQWMGVSGFLTLLVFVLVGAPLQRYLPIPVLTGIVIASLITMLEFGKAVRFWKLERSEFFVFAAAFAAELLGLSEGVIVGVVLSFASFTMKSTSQPSYFLGILRGKDGFFDLKRTPFARPVARTVLYQFNGTLFFATADEFEQDILGALRENTRLVVVTGVSAVDMYGAERLLHFYRRLKQKDIQFYLAGHAAAVNEQLIAYGAEELIRDGAVRQRLTQALEAGGLSAPYPAERVTAEGGEEVQEPPVGDSALETFTWAYGRQAVPRLEELAKQLAREIAEDGTLNMRRLSRAEREVAGAYWGAADEEEFLNLVQMNLALESGEGDTEKLDAVGRRLFARRVQLERQLYDRGDYSAAREFILLRLRREADFLAAHPEAEEELERQRMEYMFALRRQDPGVASLIAQLRETVERENAQKNRGRQKTSQS